MKADPCYTGIIAKTPHHPTWSTTEFHSYVYELSELASHVEIEYTSHWETKEKQDTSHSRNCTLFEKLRHFAYSIVEQEREQGDYEAFKMRVEQYAHRCNNFSSIGFNSNLPINEVRATTKSVARWTWDNYTRVDLVNRGVMNLDDSLPLNSRQSMAAKRTHGERKKGTAKKVLTATQKLVNDRQKVTLTAISGISKLSRQTVRKYQAIINSVIKQPYVINLTEIIRLRESVNYAVSGNCVKPNIHERGRLHSFPEQQELNKIQQSQTLYSDLEEYCFFKPPS